MTERAAPKRAIEITIRISADTWNDVTHCLEEYVRQIGRYGELPQGVSGGYGSGDIREVCLDPEMTHDRYAEELRDYLEATRKAAKP